MRGSLPSRGAWIEIGSGMQSMTSRRSRSPYGERGLKFVAAALVGRVRVSLPLRGAWIEIPADGGAVRVIARRSPYGERGLKLRSRA